MMQVALKAKRSWEIFLFRGSFYSLLAYLEIEEWKIFRNERPNFTAWRSNFIHDMYLPVHRFSKKYADDVKLGLMIVSHVCL
jgi:hypothetical protein